MRAKAAHAIGRPSAAATEKRQSGVHRPPLECGASALPRCRPGQEGLLLQVAALGGRGSWSLIRRNRRRGFKSFPLNGGRANWLLMRRYLFIWAASLLLVATAQAQQASDAAWEHLPSAADFARVYPPRARTQHVSGRALLDCLVLRSQRLRCSVLREEPRGLGFGAAALQLARVFRIAAHTRGGRPTAGGHIHVPLTFTASPLRLPSH